ncbi:unnamed protein product [Meloidogyne enterolobii]|uniref:Uncharacterized protein n=1 Tax=Meloidogyne enterolobii TaxID=390850 RepID=A0ACB1AEX6_MELEN
MTYCLSSFYYAFFHPFSLVYKPQLNSLFSTSLPREVRDLFLAVFPNDQYCLYLIRS